MIFSSQLRRNGREKDILCVKLPKRWTLINYWQLRIRKGSQGGQTKKKQKKQVTAEHHNKRVDSDEWKNIDFCMKLTNSDS